MPVPFVLNQCVSIGVIATQGSILALVFEKKSKNFLTQGQNQAFRDLHRKTG